MAAKRKTRKKKAGTRKKTAAEKASNRAPAARKAAAKASPAPAEVAPAEQPVEGRLPAGLRDMERLLGAFRQRDWLRPFGFDWPAWPELSLERFPSIDVVDRDKEIQVKAEIPGIEKDDLSVTVTDRTLTIKGETHHEEESEEGELHRREIRRGSFSRSLTLPEDVDGSKAVASYKDGVLELRLPKRRRSKRHAVEVG